MGSGFTYLGVLFVIALMSAALAAIAIVWSTYSKREREAELLFIGGEFRDAITRYIASTPGAAQFPMTLEELIEDKRFPYVRRHLRKIYVDPMTRKTEWGLVQVPGGGIVGVYSLSDDAPISEPVLPGQVSAAAPAQKYSDWKFVIDPAQLPGSPASAVVQTPNMPGTNPAPASSGQAGAIQPVVPPSSAAGVGDAMEARRQGRDR